MAEASGATVSGTASVPKVTVERPVAFDAAGRIPVLLPADRDALGLWPEVAGFVEARLFRDDTGATVLEVLRMETGVTVRERRMLDPDAVDALRARVGAVLPETPAEVLDQSGRARLLTVWGLTGVAVYDWAVPTTFALHGGSAVGAGLVAAGAAYFGPLSLTRKAAVTRGDAVLSTAGLLFGIPDGMALGFLAGGRQLSSQALAGAMVLGSVGGGIAGYAVSSRYGLTEGRALALDTGALFGLGWGIGVMRLDEGLDDEPTRRGGAELLLGSVAGLGAATWCSARDEFTVGDARAWRAAGTAGAALPFVIAPLSDAAHERAAVTAALLGSAAGLAGGGWLLREVDFSPGRGEMVELGTWLGAGFGLGLATAHRDWTHREAAVGAALGAGVGFGAAFGSLAGNAEVPYTGGDVNILWGAATMGAHVGLAAAELGSPVDWPRGTGAAMTGGAAAGLYAGHALIGAKHLSTSQAWVVNLGQVMGGVFGGGVAYLIDPTPRQGDLYAVLTAVGAAGGFCGSWWLTPESPRGPAAVSSSAGDWMVLASPAGLFATTRPVPVLSVARRF